MIEGFEGEHKDDLNLNVVAAQSQSLLLFHLSITQTEVTTENEESHSSILFMESLLFSSSHIIYHKSTVISSKFTFIFIYDWKGV